MPACGAHRQEFGGQKREGNQQGGLCFHCWEVKPVFPMPCAACGRRPRNELEFVYSIAFSPSYHDDASLQQASRMLKAGTPPHMSPEQIEKLRPAARALSARMNEIFKTIEKEGQLPPQDGVPAYPELPDVGNAHSDAHVPGRQVHGRVRAGREDARRAQARHFPRRSAITTLAPPPT